MRQHASKLIPAASDEAPAPRRWSAVAGPTRLGLIKSAGADQDGEARRDWHVGSPAGPGGDAGASSLDADDAKAGLGCPDLRRAKGRQTHIPLVIWQEDQARSAVRSLPSAILWPYHSGRRAFQLRNVAQLPCKLWPRSQSPPDGQAHPGCSTRPANAQSTAHLSSSPPLSTLVPLVYSNTYAKPPLMIVPIAVP